MIARVEAAVSEPPTVIKGGRIANGCRVGGCKGAERVEKRVGDLISCLWYFRFPVHGLWDDHVGFFSYY